MRLAPRHVILCSSTGRELDALECYCCTGLNCLHRQGAFQRLWNDIKARPWRYEDKQWVFTLNPMFAKLGRLMRG